MTTTGEPCWIHLYTDDVDTAVSFYGDLFGWSAGEPSEEFGGYRMFLRGEEPVAGLMPNDTSEPSVWEVFLQTPDIGATVERARARGAVVATDVMAVADLGSMTSIVDPAGALVGAWQPESFPGFQARAAVGAPGWFETLTTSYRDAVAFYEDAFGWDTHVVSDTPEFRYTTLGVDQNARAGIMDGSAFLGDEPSRWNVYFQVEDTDETVAEAVAAGGQVASQAEDTPYGRVAELHDPSGVAFRIMGPNQEAG
jgi:predicted enzyme related to lactoylglutathione lyase